MRLMDRLRSIPARHRGARIKPGIHLIDDASRFATRCTGRPRAPAQPDRLPSSRSRAYRSASIWRSAGAWTWLASRRRPRNFRTTSARISLLPPPSAGIVYPAFAGYSVREIFSQRRTEIQQELSAKLTPKFTAMGLVLREVDIGKVDLPPDYRAGMEKLLSEELETEKIHYTLQLKEAQVKQQQLEAEADKVRRQTPKRPGRAGHARAGGDHEAYPAFQAEADRATTSRG